MQVYHRFHASMYYVLFSTNLSAFALFQAQHNCISYCAVMHTKVTSCTIFHFLDWQRTYGKDCWHCVTGLTLHACIIHTDEFESNICKWAHFGRKHNLLGMDVILQDNCRGLVQDLQSLKLVGSCAAQSLDWVRKQRYPWVSPNCGMDWYSIKTCKDWTGIFFLDVWARVVIQATFASCPESR